MGKKSLWYALGGTVLMLVLVLLAPLPAQMGDLLDGTEGEIGPVGTTDGNADEGKDEEDQVPGWEDLNEEEWGPRGMS